MKIGLLSPYCSQNHGTVLQAFALAYKIKLLGKDCEYLRWNLLNPSTWGKVKFLLKHPFFLIRSKQTRKKNSKDLDYSFLREPDFVSIIKKNERFVEENTPVSQKLYYSDDITDALIEYDHFIVGSDQTWCPDALYQYSPYYLPYVNKKIKSSYACSMGRPVDEVNFKKFLKNRLRSFDNVSCRDRSNAIMLSDLLNRSVPNVLDPTLLLNKNEWKPYMAKVENMPERYIVCYILGEKKVIGEYANRMGKELGIPVYYIMTRPSSCQYSNVLKDVGAAEFLWLIDNCEYLVTDSFHGTIFAINFHKQVIAFDKHEGNMYDNGRIKDVLSSYGMEQCYMTDSLNKEFPKAINYCAVDEILQNRRKLSLDYLESIIK